MTAVESRSALGVRRARVAWAARHADLVLAVERLVHNVGGDGRLDRRRDARFTLQQLDQHAACPRHGAHGSSARAEVTRARTCARPLLGCDAQARNGRGGYDLGGDLEANVQTVLADELALRDAVHVLAADLAHSGALGHSVTITAKCAGGWGARPRTLETRRTRLLRVPSVVRRLPCVRETRVNSNDLRRYPRGRTMGWSSHVPARISFMKLTANAGL